MLKKLLITLAIFILITQNFVVAQQNIISVPSSDVLPAGNIILKQSNKISPFDNGYASLTPRIIVGTGKDTEMSLGVGTKIRKHSSDVNLNIAAKKVFKIKKSTRVTIGGNIIPSFTEGKNPNSLLYAHTSYLSKKTKTTLTAGAYVAGYGQTPSSSGAIIGIDQSIVSNKLRIAADWMSGTESWGALSAGFKYRPVPTTSITTAIIVPNNNDSVIFALSVSQYLGKVFDKEPKSKDGKDSL